MKEQDVRICHNKFGGFLLSFVDRVVADRVLHAAPQTRAELTLVFQEWHRQTGTLFSLLCFRVLLAILNISTHVWPADTVQAIMGTSYVIFNPSPPSLSRADMSGFLVVAWAVHPNLIPTKLGCIVTEPELLFVEQAPPLFLCPSEQIHSKTELLSFCIVITLLEVHDFSPLSSSDDNSDASGSSSGAERYPGHDSSRFLRPWPRVHRLVSKSSSTGAPWPTLPRQGGGITWDLLASPHAAAHLKSRMETEMGRCADPPHSLLAIGFQLDPVPSHATKS